MWRDYNDTRGSAEAGQAGENTFDSRAGDYGWTNIRPYPGGLRSDRIADHPIFGKNVRIDMKSTKTGTGTFIGNASIVEIRKRNGDDGWLYGPSDYIHQEFDDCWVMADREKLAEMVDRTIDTEHKCFTLKKAREKLDGGKHVLRLRESDLNGKKVYDHTALYTEDEWKSCAVQIWPK